MKPFTGSIKNFGVITKPLCCILNPPCQLCRADKSIINHSTRTPSVDSRMSQVADFHSRLTWKPLFSSNHSIRSWDGNFRFLLQNCRMVGTEAKNPSGWNRVFKMGRANKALRWNPGLGPGLSLRERRSFFQLGIMETAVAGKSSRWGSPSSTLTGRPPHP